MGRREIVSQFCETMIEMSRMRLGVLALGFCLAGVLSGCCGGAHSHKCDFTDPFTQQDAGSDAPLACGTQVCGTETVCCVKTIAPYASCIPPEDFAYQGCMLPPGQQAPCYSPADCDAGQVCCLNEAVLSIDCQSPAMCPGGGQAGTYHACASDNDCPNQAKGSCKSLTDAAALYYCDPRVQ
jgi:hypothetical protein